MAQIQYNKTFLIEIDKDLKVRENALPVLKNKEAALRVETKRLRDQVRKLEEEVQSKIDAMKSMQRMWGEFPDLINLKEVKFKRKKIASINVGFVDNVEFIVKDFALFAHPAWFLQGVEILKEVMQLKVQKINMEKILQAVEYARRKTTQKVNLYEKVQIPFYEEAIRKIKRFLEDQENLSKSSQKVIKKRMEEVML